MPPFLATSGPREEEKAPDVSARSSTDRYVMGGAKAAPPGMGRKRQRQGGGEAPPLS